VTSTEALRRSAFALDREREEAVRLERGGIDQRVEQLLFGCLPVDVDVAGRPRSLGES
jgi:porphobilinogen deaminase